MRIIIAILTLGLLTSIQIVQDRRIDQFVNSQLDEFEIIRTFKTGYFVNSIENYRLHTNKLEIAIKAKKHHLNSNDSGKKVYTQIQLWQFDFDTNQKCVQVVDSLLNCFPYDCTKIRRQVDLRIKIAPSIWILGNKSIYIAKTSCEQVDEKWIDFKKNFADTFADEDTAIIVADCGKITWTTKERIVNAP